MHLSFSAQVLALLMFAPLTFASWENLFPKDVKISKSGPLLIFRYCPDETCDEMETKVARREAEDVFALFLFGGSTYVYLNDDFVARQAVITYIRSLVAKHNPECEARPTIRKAAACALKKKLSSKKFQFFSSRFDEGEKHRGPIDLSRNLDRVGQE